MISHIQGCGHVVAEVKKCLGFIVKPLHFLDFSF